MFDTAHTRQCGTPLFHVFELDHEGRLKIAAIGDQRVVGPEFLFNTTRFENTLYAQHFLDLILNGQAILEIEPGIGPQRNLPVLFVRQHLGTKTRSLLGIAL